MTTGLWRFMLMVFAIFAAVGLATGTGWQWLHALNLVIQTFAFIDVTVQEYTKPK